MRLTRFLSKIRKTRKCWEWVAGKDEEGYGQFWYERRNRKAHQVAYLLFRGPIPPGRCVLHRCDNPSCVRPSHLFLGSLSDNAIDCLIKGRSRHKGSVARVIAIRERYRKGESAAELAVLFGLSESQARRIARERQWRFV